LNNYKVKRLTRKERILLYCNKLKHRRMYIYPKMKNFCYGATTFHDFSSSKSFKNSINEKRSSLDTHLWAFLKGGQEVTIEPLLAKSERRFNILSSSENKKNMKSAAYQRYRKEIKRSRWLEKMIITAKRKIYILKKNINKLFLNLEIKQRLIN